MDGATLIIILAVGTLGFGLYFGVLNYLNAREAQRKGTHSALADHDPEDAKARRARSEL